MPLIKLSPLDCFGFSQVRRSLWTTDLDVSCCRGGPRGTALITGASAGIGTELVKLFARDGHSVCLVVRRQNRLKRLCKELKAINSNIRTWICVVNLTAIGAPQAIRQFTERENITVDFLVNNAGFGSTGRFTDLELAKELEIIDLNIRAWVALKHLCLPSMLLRKSGCILM